MTVDELLAAIENKLPPASEVEISAFEKSLGQQLPSDYRDFVVRCNGGFAGGGNLVFPGPIGEVSINHIGGFREESYFSLKYARENYLNEYETRIPKDLVWIADDPGGNALCIGISGDRRGRVYFWDHECEPDPEVWDGTFESAGNIDYLAESFSEFVSKLARA